ncbi:mitochondrial 37S ribosomal protein mS45 [Calcarisporiella thermophila]|uniref:mitochondrial 37S ribosomal protein mS45 n=1 Tax=Calcarisporiella thermophila TaxID=911321 RepID=UPI00374303AD
MLKSILPRRVLLQTIGRNQFPESRVLYGFVSYRGYQSTLTRFSQEQDVSDTQDPSDQASLDPPPTATQGRRRRKFLQWLTSDGERFRKPTFGQTNYVGSTPFPMNPLFKANAPLSDKTRETIYQLYTNDPTRWTPRHLAQKFNISIRRAEAVIKLKNLERDIEEKGFSLQNKYQESMESLMGVAQNESKRFKEALAEVIPSVGKPRFKTVEEETTFTPKDAARVLGRLPFEEAHSRLLKAEMHKSSTLGRRRTDMKIIERDPSQQNARFQFMFTDISKNIAAENRRNRVREKDGTLHESVANN